MTEARREESPSQPIPRMYRRARRVQSSAIFLVVALVVAAYVHGTRAAGFFEVKIETSEQNLAYTTNPTPVFSVDFNAQNLTVVNPLKLFDISGSSRVDVVYSQALGLMYVMAAVDNATAPGAVVLTVNEGVTSSEQGGANSFAQSKVEYVPSAQQGNAVADVAGWGMLGGLAVSLGATMFAPGSTIGVGAINFAGFVQTFYMSGNLPITNMPSLYRSSTTGLVADWVLLNPPVGPAVDDEAKKEEEEEKEAARSVLQDLSVMMPYPPVVVTFDSAEGEMRVGEEVSEEVADEYEYEVVDEVVDETPVPPVDAVGGDAEARADATEDTTNGDNETPPTTKEQTTNDDANTPAAPQEEEKEEEKEE